MASAVTTAIALVDSHVQVELPLEMEACTTLSRFFASISLHVMEWSVEWPVKKHVISSPQQIIRTQNGDRDK